MSTPNLRLEALNILSKVPLIGEKSEPHGHNDWPHLIRAYYKNALDDRFAVNKNLAGHVDVSRLIRGKSGGAFWSVFMPCPKGEADLENMVRDTLQQIDLVYRLAELYADKWEMCESADDIMRIFEKGKFVCLMGVEGLHQIGDSSSVLRMYHKLGVRYVTLTHSKHNQYADSATSNPPLHGGLSAKGKEIIREMNRIGMMIDLSHTSRETTLSALELSLAPVAFTHSCVANIVSTDRNVSDEALDKLKLNRGIIMIALIPTLNHLDSSIANISHVIDHILYVAERIGFDHIGLGSDYDGMMKAVNGLEDVSRYPDLVEAMLIRGISRENVEKIIGRNVIRVLKEVEECAKRYGRELSVLEDSVKPLWDDDLCAVVKSVYPEAEH
ncbi:membrane dipeptidase GliJ [Talaromyces marneffei ATCC 18224]|uniref:Dipeptidase n=1 Tax=Talaromyces marneffei (strain ATCC 18224 / CBS 334.59 / QM 7333) TaxID=441960 RepID=B6Q4T1_TALMQ|nr:membrane dipeptidase GliJ [Talaromyces marneffei ATCC 18224]